MGTYITHIPRPPLAHFVENLWFYEADEISYARERRLPNGSIELIINLREDELCIYDARHENQIQSLGRSAVCGAYSRFFVIDSICRASLMGIAFKPGGAFPFLSMPASELQNIHVSLEVLWGMAANDLRDQLLEVGTTQARFRVLEEFLLARAARSPVPQPAVAFALAEFQRPARVRTIAEIVEQTGYSTRHFIQLFHERVGLTPKQFCRVRRFQDVLNLIEKGGTPAWTDIALACGYFDQAHFIHDFRDFCGLTPGMYLARRGEFRNHVPLS